MIDKLAQNIAKKAHKGQKDLGGNDYYDSHLFYVGNSFSNPILRSIGFLHDILEDTNYTEESLKKELFSHNLDECDIDKVIEAVVLLTKKSGESYSDYISKIKKNPLAKQVKLVDMKQNSDLSRLKKITLKDIMRKNKYEDNINFLEEL